MYQIDFERPSRVHFTGIGGIGMSGLAELLIDRGFTVSGSDVAENALTRRLADIGAVIFRGQRAENITDDIDAVIYTAAVHEDNPEYQAAMRLGIPMLSRAELLGQIMKNYHDAVAVAGTHGKTTTTSMIAEILLAAGADPTVSVGGILPSIGGNMRVGHSDCFVAEACEYTNSYHSLFPTVGVILNIREDHLDFFKDIGDIRDSFHGFAELVPADGCLVISADIPDCGKFVSDLVCPAVTFALDPGRADYGADNISYDEYGCASFDVIRRGEKTMRISLKVPGEHNITNALAAAAAAYALGIPGDAVAKGLFGYGGTDRRFEIKGDLRGVTVIDDYAHHPDEIRATLNAAKMLHKKKIWCVFQPHTYTRTKALMKEFAEALTLADEVILAKIYPARETDTLGISSADLADEIANLGKEAHYFESFGEIEDFLLKNLVPNELLITMGAGDVVKIGESLLGL